MVGESSELDCDGKPSDATKDVRAAVGIGDGGSGVGDGTGTGSTAAMVGVGDGDGDGVCGIVSSLKESSSELLYRHPDSEDHSHLSSVH